MGNRGIETKVSCEKALKEFFGFDKFKGDQKKVIENVLSGRDSFVIMPTGGGKSLCYQLPALMSEGTAVVVSPLIALMKNQVDSIRSFGKQDGIAHFLNSSLNKTEITKVKADVTAGITKLLYVAPESLAKQDNINFLTKVKVSFFAIDEAHCISEWGHDFRPEYRRLRPTIEKLGDIPIIALTATATQKVQQDIQKNLGMLDADVYKASFNRPNLYYEVRPKGNALKELVKYIKKHQGKSGIVYCLSRKKVEEIAQVLQVNGIKALPYHAGMEANMRSRHQDQFLMEEVDVIVATIAFGMGIDKPDVRFVIHHDIPKSIESYYQETGRCGRDGGEGNCIAFYSYKDIEKLEKFLQGKPVSEQEIGKQLLEEMVSYAETSICRRKYLLHYFGENYDSKHCTDTCDNCRHPKERFEGKEDVALLLKTISTLKEVHKANHLVQVLIGDETQEVKKYKHHSIDLFAAGAKHDDKYWHAVIRQSIVLGLIKKDIESYGILKITPKGKEFLQSPYSIELHQEHDYSSEEEEDLEAISHLGNGIANSMDKTLFQMLKELRKKIAKEKGLPPFVIFQDPSLQDMTIQYPTSMEELNNIVGVGQGKSLRYGKPFLALIEKYVNDNDIKRPQDLVVKSIVNKSGLKVHIIQNIDRQLPLEDIASAKGKTLEHIIEELEAIVSSGTKVNINYYIDDMLDEDAQNEIFDYFMEAETDAIQNAVDEFIDDYTEEEVRLMRIKFFSDLAN